MSVISDSSEDDYQGFSTSLFISQVIKEFLRIGVSVYIAGCDGTSVIKTMPFLFYAIAIMS